MTTITRDGFVFTIGPGGDLSHADVEALRRRRDEWRLTHPGFDRLPLDYVKAIVAAMRILGGTIE